MNLRGGISDFFGLDIGITGLRVVQLKGTGAVKTLEHYGQTQIQGNLALSDSKPDRESIGKAVKELAKQAGITTTNVAVNLPSSRVFATVSDWDQMSEADLAKTIRYQAESIIPTPLSKSKLDWVVVGPSPKDAKKIEVLLSSVSNEFIEARLDMLEAVGLNVIAFEPDSMALTRSLVASDVTLPQMVLDMGNASTDLIITMNGVPRLIRSIPTGGQTLVRAAMQSLSIEQSQAEQFVYKFGLGKDKLEGQIYNAIIGTVEALMAEIEKSIKFFQSRYTNAKIDRIIVTGGASALPELPLYIANRFGLNVEIGNAWRNISFPATSQDELLAVSNHFAVAAGLAERQE